MTGSARSLNSPGAEDLLGGGSRFRYEKSGGEPSVVARLEMALQSFTGARYCLAMNSCSSALLIALRAGGLQLDEPVLCPAFTFAAVPSAVILAGGKPILVECTPDYVVDIEDLVRQIEITQARWLMLSYMRGFVPELDRVLEVCRANGVAVVEDAAHAMGVQYRGRHVGGFGIAGTFSFQSYKLLDGGEGGLLITDDEEIAARAVVMSGCYEENWEDHVCAPQARVAELVNTLPMFNMRMSNVTAALLLDQLVDVEERIAHYAQLYDVFVEVLGSAPAVRFPERPGTVRPVTDSVQFEIECVDVEAVREFAIRAACVLPSAKVIGLDATNARRFWGWTFMEQPECPRTRSLLERTVDFRLSADWTVQDAGDIAADLRAALAASHAV